MINNFQKSINRSFNKTPLEETFTGDISGCSLNNSIISYWKKENYFWFLNEYNGINETWSGFIVALGTKFSCLDFQTVSDPRSMLAGEDYWFQVPLIRLVSAGMVVCSNLRWDLTQSIIYSALAVTWTFLVHTKAGWHSLLDFLSWLEELQFTPICLKMRRGFSSWRSLMFAAFWGKPGGIHMKHDVQA